MIIKRIRSIDNIGQFFKTTMNGSLGKDFTKMSLIYGLNGFGKSTISEILRSLKENNGQTLQGKRTIPEKGDPYVKLSFAPDFNSKETIVEYSKGAWSSAVDNLEIFDCKFISENVYSDFEITHEHKKKISALILGDDGVVIAKEIEGIQKNINDVKKEQTDTLSKMAYLLPRGFSGSTDTFIAIPEKDKEQVKNKAKLLKSLKTVQEIEKVKKLVSPEPIATVIDVVGKEIAEIDSVLALSLDTMSSDVVERVQKHITENLDSRGEDWLQKGLSYHNDKNCCPFCTQQTDNNEKAKEAIASYSKFFSTEYEAYINKINSDTRALQSQISRKINSVSLFGNTFHRNNLLVNHTKDYVEESVFSEMVASFAEMENDIITKASDFVDGLQSIRADIDVKISAKGLKPLVPIKLDAFDNNAVLTKEVALNDVIKNYNSLVEKTTATIEGMKTSTVAGKQAEIEKELIQIEAIEARYSVSAVGLISKFEAGKASLVDLDKQKVAKEAELIAHNKTVADKYLKEANDVLKDCGCRFKIRIPDDFSRRGASPVIDLGFELMGTNVDGKKFGEMLSESDKRCLAFALFVAKLNTDDVTLKDKVIILDDPFTSLDDNRQDNTIFQIKKLESKCAQLIVLCHYSQPIAELAKDFKGSLQLSIENTPMSGSILLEKDLIKLRNNKHLCNLDELQNVLDNTIPDEQFPTVRATTRTVLEHEILSRFRPSLKGVTDTTLGNLITELDNQVKAGNAILKGDKPDDIILALRHINSKTAPEHHADTEDGSNKDNIENLRGIIRQTFSIIYNKL